MNILSIGWEGEIGVPRHSLSAGMAHSETLPGAGLGSTSLC